MKAEDAIQAVLDELDRVIPPRKLKPRPPKLVTDRGEIVGSATVDLSPSDPNWRGSGSRYVKVLDRWEHGGPAVITDYDPFKRERWLRFHD